MTPAQVREAGPHVQLVDVREPEEWEQVHVDGAVHIPMDQIPDRLTELVVERPVAVLCRVGQRSARVAQYLQERGFDAHNVEGGIEQWARAGVPLHHRGTAD